MRFVIQDENRPLGVFISGLPSFGKSSLVQDLVLQDIKADQGVCVIDPTSDLIERIAAHIPREQAAKTIIFDTKDPIPIDLFSYRDPLERRVSLDLISNIFDLEDAPLSRPRLIKGL